MTNLKVQRDEIPRVVILIAGAIFLLGILVGFLWSEIRSVERYNTDMQSLEDSLEFNP